MSASVIVSAARTPIGGFQGVFSQVPATELGAVATRAAVARAGIDPACVEELLFGCVLPAGLGQSPARQVSLGAGLPQSTGVLTINKVCSSGLRAIMLADQLTRVGDHQVVVAGGMESMTRAPYLFPNARSGCRIGHGLLIDAMIHDGLWDAFHHLHMGNIAEQCAREFKITRAAQDAFAVESYTRAQQAEREGWWAEEIVPVPLAQRNGDPVMIAQDEGPGKFDPKKFAALKPAFEKEGTITAGNASSISDGAAAVVVMEEGAARKQGLRPLARIVAHATASQAPEWYTTAPVQAITKALAKAGLCASDIDLFEINEAFACVVLHAIAALQLDPQRVNVHGGAVALGHPIGASGARLVVTLLHAMRRRGARRGCVALCNGGGEATAMIVENCA